MKPKHLVSLCLCLVLITLTSFYLNSFPWESELDSSKLVYYSSFFLLSFISYFFLSRLNFLNLQIGWAIFTLYPYGQALEEIVNLPDSFISSLLSVFPGIVGMALISIGFFTLHKEQLQKLTISQERGQRLQHEAASYKTQANRDALTGLLNRKGLLEELQPNCQSHLKLEQTLAVMFIDLDKFKPINDTYGHKVGDVLLQKIAQRLQHQVRENDLVARWGGDEFIVVLTHLTDAISTQHYVEQLSKAFDEPVAIDDVKHLVGSSIGVALCPTHSDRPNELIDLADKAMYEAKQSKGVKLRYATPIPNDAFQRNTAEQLSS